MTQHDYSLAVTGESWKMPTLSVRPEIEAIAKKAHYANVSNVKTNRKYREKFKDIAKTFEARHLWHIHLKSEVHTQSLAVRALSTQLDLAFAALDRSRRRQLLLFSLLLFNTAAIVYMLYERLF